MTSLFLGEILRASFLPVKYDFYFLRGILRASSVKYDFYFLRGILRASSVKYDF